MKARGPAIAAALALVSGPLAGQELRFPPGEDARFHWDSFEALKSQDLAGQRLTILGPWLGPDKALFDSVIAYFEAATGAEVTYNGSDNFEQQIVIDAGAGSPPDIAVFPQPGLARDLASKGQLAPLDPATADWLRENYAAGESWVSLGTFPGRDGTEALYGFFYKIDVKSLVWYVPENFADFGYEIPRTMEELRALTERMVADGVTPWCIGLASGGGHRMARDRLGRGHDAAHQPSRGLRSMDLERDPVRRSAGGGRHRGVRLVRAHARLRGGRPECRGRDRLPRQPEGPVLRAAPVLHAQAGELHPPRSFPKAR